MQLIKTKPRQFAEIEGGRKKGTKHPPPLPNSLILYIHVGRGKLNGKFANKKNIEKGLCL